MSAQERNVLAELTLLHSAVAQLRENVRELREEMRALREEVRNDISELREEVRHDIRELREDVRSIRNSQFVFAVAVIAALLGVIATLLVKL